ncbi:hypothetical protein A5844_002186 [Enterococcus sp. 10A9_DIV0425]|uniref:Uncharacterized protein n=1 Tax=Candidatus Enterococcus wittei TaxID=1987383 RepID=A0A242JYU2_9ENTE|nr:hypothetical protein [Enterococcus sp. 10A9_DIV0425]OTP10486.1 hypothetical protein A5844_002186 [Enterococcus sp. 10A9_DIV0425]THE12899.1 hypothetical protein E1H99_06790 [Enterococcus hirae]
MNTNIHQWFVARKEKRKLELRKKNWKLRQAGKDPNKGWNSMVDSGLGGINNMNRDTEGVVLRSNEIDNKAYFLEEAKRRRNSKSE